MKTTTKIKLLLLTIVLISINQTTAQGIIDGFFNKKGNANLSLSYTFSNYDSFYRADEKMDAGIPVHEEISQNIINLYANYAISDKLTVIANLPYIQTEGKGANDPVNATTEQTDLQDLSIALKYALYTQELNNGNFNILSALSGSIPLGYEPNGILSIGNGAPSLDAKIGTHYKHNNGLFATAILGYTVRGEADNNFELGDGSKYNAPNSANSLFKIGYACDKIYVDAWFDSQTTSKKGIDIGTDAFAANFPELRVNYSRIGGTVYAPITNAFGINAGISTLVDGRNIGIATTYTAGLIYSIKKN